MSLIEVLAPVFVQVALCFGLLFGMIGARSLAGTPKPGDDAATAASHAAWMVRAKRISASYSNQFEMPVLFFGLVPLALITQKADAMFVVLAWVYVVGRLAQCAVHVTVNVVPLRGACFFVGCIALGVAWIRLFLALTAG